MAFFRSLVSIEMALLGLLMLATLDFTVAQTGVCYGMLGDNLPPPGEVIELYNQNNIRRMRIYGPDKATLDALGGSNIELMLGVANEELESLAADQEKANNWVQDNVKNYPNVKYIAVGNEISPLRTDTSRFVPFVVPAMRTIQNAISSAQLGDRIKVSTAIETGTLGPSFPPKDTKFKPEVKQYLEGIIQFLVENRAPFLANIYPYFARVGDQKIDLEYALFTSSSGVVTPDGTQYQNLFYAMLDAMYAAVEAAGGSSLKIVVSESGWPSDGGPDASIDNARMYNTNLVQRIRDGTPKRPGKPIETYIFAMFDENQKEGAESEKFFGLFRPDKQAKYSIGFN